ncbi:hypothetical protein [Corynebacterium ulceribovis]|uniref:hypothetical protein n=1 Tax=Corynebacterium ulceribovis TaxID=487732 RepID=UPI0003A0CDED|nr:hypothetical protein [Corynebacterium ulceribovis]
MNVTTADMASLGLNYSRWQDAAQAAIATNDLFVDGELRGGQLVRWQDPASGARIHMLGVEPFATWVGFEGTREATAHIDMLDDVLALIDVVEADGMKVGTVTANLAQGPLLVEDGMQEFQQVAITALAIDAKLYDSETTYRAEHDAAPRILISEGALVVVNPSGSAKPDSAARIAGTVTGVEKRTNGLTGQAFWHVIVDSPIPVDLCLPIDFPEPAVGNVISGRFSLTATVLEPVGASCGTGGCGSCGGGCGH